MKYYWSVFLWENGQRTVDYTNNLSFPIFLEDRLNEELDTGEIILENMDISTKKGFPPKTKFRIELRLNEDDKEPFKKWDMVVDHDDVEEYVGLPEICCHRISLIEPSVITQGMHVDNIALTYELQDVTLNYKTSYNPDDTVIVSSFLGGGSIKEYENYQYREYTPSNTTGYRTTSFCYDWENLENGISMSTIIREQSIKLENKIEFDMPVLYLKYWNGSSFEKLFELPTKCEIFRSETINGIINASTEELVFSQIFNPTTAPNRNDNVVYKNSNFVGIRSYNDVDKTIDADALGGISYRVFLFDDTSEFSPLVYLGDTKHSNRRVVFYTSALDEDIAYNEKRGYFYKIRLSANPYGNNSMVTYYKKKGTTSSLYYKNFGDQLIGQKSCDVKVVTEALEIANPSNIYSETTFRCRYLTETAPPNPFITKGVKYSCLDLFRKAMLSVDTQIFDNKQTGLDISYDNPNHIKYPIKVSDEWIEKLSLTKIYETILEEKNLWEVLIQIGYYLHAIPYLEFSENGEDCFVLKFRQLGSNKRKEDSANKITIFNSTNVSEYFATFDSYVKNLFSPQNLIEEWVTPKTSDDSYLISNDTAELQLKYPITEIVEFDITYDASKNNHKGVSGTKSALDRIFEKSIYNILSSQYSRQQGARISPSKGTSLYYELGNNKILGLNYVPPTKNNDGLMALKDIVTDLFQGTDSSWDAKNLKFNSLSFHIKYRTQDELRITQVRPDIQNFLKSSAYEKYPHHEQFYNSQDKIVDSERFSANLWGKLIRVGNNVYQEQEQVENVNNIKESGDLIEISNTPYYVTEAENEGYPDEVFQKVTYSKNFNEISQVVTIPSEPRFYEVSERSTIRREVRMMDFFILSTIPNTETLSPKFLKNNWQKFLRHLLFNDTNVNLPNYALVKYKADKLRQHTSSHGEIIDADKLFPSSEVKYYYEGEVLVSAEPKESRDSVEVIVPILHFPMKNCIAFEWDMDDNFKAGDYVDTSISGDKGTTDSAYYAQQSVRYCDIMGRADLFSFKLFYKNDWTYTEQQTLPRVLDVNIDSDNCFIFLNDELSIGLDKDNREALSFNYQINLLTDIVEEDNEQFVTYPNLFGEKTGKLKACLLDKTVSMFEENVGLRTGLVKDDIDFTILQDDKGISISFSQLPPDDLSNVKSIVLYCEDNEGKTAYIAKNVSNLSNLNKLQAWYIYPIFNGD